MNFTLSEEQTMLSDLVSRFLMDSYDFDQRRQRMEASGGYDSELWRQLTAELGIAGASLPESIGGMGGGAVETMVIMECLGKALVVEPFLETVVWGGTILARTDSERARELLRGVIAGEVRLAVGAAEISAAPVLEEISTKAVRDGEEWVINGSKPVVWGAPSATHLLVSARTERGAGAPGAQSIFVIPADSAGINRHDFRLVDDRPASDIELVDVRLPADALLGVEGGALPVLQYALDCATAAYCADAVGGMRQMLDATVEYTKQRQQFGKPLSSFQVLQHRMVNMYIALEQAVSAVHLATLNLEADDLKRARAVSAAKVTVAQSARMVGQGAVQLHGAMGMTNELAVGHYFKRATVFEYAFGSAAYHLKRYGALNENAAAA